MMLAEAKREDMSHPLKGAVESWTDIKDIWTADPSESNAEKMYRVCFGIFDENPRWQETLMERYFAHKRWKYIDNASKKKQPRGCFERLASLTKDDLSHQLQKGGLKAHGKVVTIYRRTKEEREAKTKYWRRKMGVFEAHMFVGKKTVETTIVEQGTVVENTETAKMVRKYIW